MNKAMTVMTLVFLASSASAGTRTVDAGRCEARMRLLQVTSYVAGVAWSELNQTQKAGASYDQVQTAVEKMRVKQAASDNAFAEAIRCLYE